MHDHVGLVIDNYCNDTQQLKSNDNCIAIQVLQLSPLSFIHTGI